MPLRDRIYLRIGLFHQRYGRMWAAFLEGILIAISAFVIGLTIFGLANLAYMVYEDAVDTKAKVYKQQAASYQNTLLACLQGGVIGRTADGEVVACEGAFTFRISERNPS